MKNTLVLARYECSLAQSLFKARRGLGVFIENVWIAVTRI
jgi:hypothetical protein